MEKILFILIKMIELSWRAVIKSLLNKFDYIEKYC